MASAHYHQSVEIGREFQKKNKNLKIGLAQICIGGLEIRTIQLTIGIQLP